MNFHAERDQIPGKSLLFVRALSLTILTKCFYRLIKNRKKRKRFFTLFLQPFRPAVIFSYMDVLQSHHTATAKSFRKRQRGKVQMNQTEKTQVIEFMKSLGNVITEMFGYNCEVSISIQEGDTPRVAYIYNGHVTDRKVGDPVTANLEYKVNFDHEDEYINYAKYDRHRKKKFKSSTIVHSIGDLHFFFCINLDVDRLETARLALNNLLRTNADQGELSLFEKMDSDTLSTMIKEVLDTFKKPVHKFGRADKLLAVQLLQEKGALEIKKSVPAISEALNVSRTTLYNYLKALEK